MWCEVVVDTGDMKIAIILGYEGLNVSTGGKTIYHSTLGWKWVSRLIICSTPDFLSCHTDWLWEAAPGDQVTRTDKETRRKQQWVETHRRWVQREPSNVSTINYSFSAYKVCGLFQQNYHLFTSKAGPFNSPPPFQPLFLTVHKMTPVILWKILPIPTSFVD